MQGLRGLQKHWKGWSAGFWETWKCSSTGKLLLMSLAVCDIGGADSQEILSILWRACCAAGNNQVNSIKVQWDKWHGRVTCGYECAHLLSYGWLFATPWTVACQTPLTAGFPRQEYWSGLPLPIPGDIPDLRIGPAYLASPTLAGRFLILAEKPRSDGRWILYHSTTWEAL